MQPVSVTFIGPAVSVSGVPALQTGVHELHWGPASPGPVPHHFRPPPSKTSHASARLLAHELAQHLQLPTGRLLT